MLNPQDSTISTQPRSDSTIQNLFDLSGRIALVTGACGHLGRALSFALAEAGANLIIVSRTKKDLDQVSKIVKKYKWIAWVGLLAVLIVAIELIYTDIKVLLL